MYALKDCVSTKQLDDYARDEIKTGGDCGARETDGLSAPRSNESPTLRDSHGGRARWNRLLQHPHQGNGRSEQRNEGSEGVAPAKIATKIFERDGDVNTDDAHFSNPGVRVSGMQIEGTEPTI